MQLGLQLGAEPETLPMLVIAKGLDSYHYDGDVHQLTVENIKDFINDYKAEKIPLYVKN